MFRLKSSLRLGLILLFMVAAAAITWSFVARRVPERPPRRTALLGDKEARSMTGAVYQERKAGNVSFEVRADLSIESETGIYTLQNVGLTRFDEQGKSTNLVSGQKAIYDTGQKTISFAGNVKLKLADGTDIFSESLGADLKREVVQISGSFRFKRGDASGQGRALQYLIQPKQVSVDGDFELVLPLDDGKVTIRALKAFHDLPTHRVSLTGGASIEGDNNRLSADQIDVNMDDQNRLEKSVGTGRSRLDIGTERSFSGQQITMLFNPADKTLTNMEVTEGGATVRAVYEERTAKGASRLQAGKIIVNPNHDPALGKKVVLKDFTADRNVLLKSESLGITDSHGDHLVGTFAAGGKDLRQIDLTGHVLVVRQNQDKSQRLVEERLTSRTLQLTFLPGQILDQALARAQVDVISKTKGSTRHLSARQSVQLFYKDGQPARVESRGGSRFDETVGEGHRTVTAPSMDAFYKGGLLDRLSAQPGVSVTVEENGTVRRSTSERLEASYSQGQLTIITQQGNVQMRDEQKDSRADLRADRGDYDARTGTMVATGSPAPVFRYVTIAEDGKPGSETETRADKIEFDRQSDRIRGQGAVRTILNENGDLIVVQSSQLEADRQSGWAVYSGSPRITQKTGSVAGRVVRYSSKEQKLIVEDDVVSTSDQGDKKYRVVSKHLVYDRQSGRARYEGAVELTSVDLNVKAPFVELVFGEEEQRNRVTEVVAWGGVEIVQGERKAKGPRAVYYPENQKVVMTAS